MSAERQKRIYEGVSAVRDAIPTEVGRELLEIFLQDLTAGLASEPIITGGTIRRWINDEGTRR